jgi:hypothetical protein
VSCFFVFSFSSSTTPFFPSLSPLSQKPKIKTPKHSFLPHVGRVTIIMNDYPLVKYALIGILGLFVVTSKE